MHWAVGHTRLRPWCPPLTSMRLGRMSICLYHNHNFWWHLITYDWFAAFSCGNLPSAQAKRELSTSKLPSQMHHLLWSFLPSAACRENKKPLVSSAVGCQPADSRPDKQALTCTVTYWHGWSGEISRRVLQVTGHANGWPSRIGPATQGTGHRSPSQASKHVLLITTWIWPIPDSSLRKNV